MARHFGNSEIHGTITLLTSFSPLPPENTIIYTPSASLPTPEIALSTIISSLPLYERINLPSGVSFIQEGKDLSKVKNILGSGGGIVYAKNHKKILSEAIFDPNERLILKPKDPKLFIDKDYVLWAAGLLSQVDPETAYSIISKSLIQV